MAVKIRRFVYPKTLSEFARCRAPFRGVMGPFGSGKSSACCHVLMWMALEQEPNRDRVRETRWAVIRQTYSQLRDTTLATWKYWYPHTITKGVGPIEAYYRRRMDDGTTLDMKLWFVSLDRPDDVAKLSSWEVTGAWINEARDIDWTFVEPLRMRMGRYPPYDPESGLPGATYPWMIADTNPPPAHELHWWYRLAECTPHPDMKFFRQPPAMFPRLHADGSPVLDQWNQPIYDENPLAENVEHLKEGFDYYRKGIVGATPEWIKVHVMGEYGNTFDGLPVYQFSYNDARHMSALPLPIWRNTPLILAWDFGLTPACLVLQLTPFGVLHVLREYCSTGGGLRHLVQTTVGPALATEFQGMSYVSVGDPAGGSGADHDAHSCFSELAALGIPTQAAPGNNELAVRIEAVNYFLQRWVDPTPGLVIDPSCKLIQMGFQGGYKFARIQVSERRYAETPVKNEYSHPHDALQYGCLWAKGHGVRGEIQARRAQPSRKVMAGRVR